MTFWDDWTDDPNESGIPEDEGSGDTYWDMALDLDITSDADALDLLMTGWFDADADPDERAAAREEFFDYMDMDSGDFDWQEWREYYEG